MIDLHCHILPDLDDGATDVEDSVAMARQAQADGIATVCATPHVRHDHPVQIASLPARVAALQTELDRRGVGVRVAVGAEVAQTQLDGLDDEALRTVSLGGAGGWILLEPAPGPLSAELELCVERLRARGMRAVIAHPERHADADLELRLELLAAQGCLIQWTAAFVADAALREPVARWARMGLIHLLGSDAHSARFGRPVALADGFAALRGMLPAATVEWMAHTGPQAVLRGEPIGLPAFG
ncbi:MAG TPA: CpsB/CapC family capsule biosynthesis tyrosine phosphatase [Conexibacter sp.]|nr:CpsB/CapC family capsule biosynthesis tyrosine phosphatase [Conexibacter sp.]